MTFVVAQKQRTYRTLGQSTLTLSKHEGSSTGEEECSVDDEEHPVLLDRIDYDDTRSCNTAEANSVGSDSVAQARTRSALTAGGKKAATRYEESLGLEEEATRNGMKMGAGLGLDGHRLVT